MRRLLPLLVLVLAAGCGEREAPITQVDATPAPAMSPAPATEPSTSTATSRPSPAIVSMTTAPGSDALVLGTGGGMYRLRAGQRQGRRFEGRLATPDGEGLISDNVVLAAAGDALLGSGHPLDAEGALPEDLGLIRSEDGGETWESVSLLGEADLHALDARGDVVVGQPVEEARLVVSTDGGRSFTDRTPPDVPYDVDLDPRDPRQLLITTPQGVYSSPDLGRSWRQRDVLTVETLLAWAPSGTVYRVEAGGVVRASEDGGATWSEKGDAGGPPTAATVDGDGRLHVALAGARIMRSDDGGMSFDELGRLGG